MGGQKKEDEKKKKEVRTTPLPPPRNYLVDSLFHKTIAGHKSSSPLILRLFNAIQLNLVYPGLTFHTFLRHRLMRTGLQELCRPTKRGADSSHLPLFLVHADTEIIRHQLDTVEVVFFMMLLF